MRVAIEAPWLARPAGGMTVLFAYGNGLVDRGHQVAMIATRMGHGVPDGGESVDELRSLDWLTVDDRLQLVDGGDAAAVAALEPDVLIRFSPEPLAGPPPWRAAELVVIQALRVLPNEFEQPLLSYPAPKLAVARWLADAADAHHHELGLTQPVFHLPNGIDHRRFRPPADSEASDAERPIDVAMIYNPAPSKATPVGVKATEAVRATHPALRVEMFGAYPRPDWLEPHITYHEQPARQQLVELYQQSKVFLLSSGVEGFGLASLEAMACGAALVTTNNGGSADFAEADHNALVAAPGDPEALAAHLQTLLRDPARRAEIAAAGLATAQRFRWSTTIDGLEALLLQMVDPQG